MSLKSRGRQTHYRFPDRMSSCRVGASRRKWPGWVRKAWRRRYLGSVQRTASVGQGPRPRLTVSVCQGFLNKKTMGQVTEITEMCLLTVLEAGTSRIQVPAALLSESFPVHPARAQKPQRGDSVFPVCSLMSVVKSIRLTQLRLAKHQASAVRSTVVQGWPWWGSSSCLCPHPKESLLYLAPRSIKSATP